MKVLFSVLTPAFLKNYESAVRLLAQRGHEVHLAFHTPTRAKGVEALAESLCSESSLITMGQAPTPRKDRWLNLAMDLRGAVDYLYFRDPKYHQTYRLRAEKRAPNFVKRWVERPPFRGRTGAKVLQFALRAAERATPVNPVIEAYLARHRPDVVLFTPLIGLRTIQPQYLRAAQALGIPNGACVSSWDNLTSKSTLRPVPDLIMVWNEMQKREAMDLHAIPGRRVAVTGAQCYDQWFDWAPRPREKFCRGVGLDSAKPYLLYVCSTPFLGSAGESGHVVRWIERLRASDDSRLREAGVLVRPHPKRAREWLELDLSRFENISVYPRRENQIPIDWRSKSDFYDSIYHSAAVVGLNTSALIESGVVGRRVHALLVDEFWDSQAGTLHFPYLMDIGGGLLRTAATMEDHLAQLAETLSSPPDASANLGFLEEFVRPFGIDIPATPVFVDRVEQLAAMGLGRSIRTPIALRPLRAALSPFARRAPVRLDDVAMPELRPL